MTDVKRFATSGAAGDGAMLYKPSQAGKFAVPWFEPRYWMAQDAVVGEALGRGTTYIVREGERQLVLRHYRRGGLIARLSPDRYLWRGESATRPFRELQMIDVLHDAGLPVPAPVAARYQREGAFYRGDILTQFIPDTQSLAQRLAGTGVSLNLANLSVSAPEHVPMLITLSSRSTAGIAMTHSRVFRKAAKE